MHYRVSLIIRPSVIFEDDFNISSTLNPARVTSKHKHFCCPLSKMGRFCLFAYTGLTDRFRRARGFFLQLSKFSQAHPIRKKHCVDFGKNFM